MSVDKEFATIDVLLASEAETRGVDAFALALIKAERQMRKLFTYVVFQSPAFGSADVPALRNALASRRVYFRDFLSAWDGVYPRPLAELVGAEYDRLRAVLDEAIEHRNKIFHGQLTTKYLSRDELLAYVAQIRCWCQALAAGAQQELGYDGFGRNSFRKSADSALPGRLVAKMTSVGDYETFLNEMERRPDKALQPTTRDQGKGNSTKKRAAASG